MEFDLARSESSTRSLTSLSALLCSLDLSPRRKQEIAHAARLDVFGHDHQDLTGRRSFLKVRAIPHISLEILLRA
jgi:hypothetical protein